MTENNNKKARNGAYKPHHALSSNRSKETTIEINSKAVKEAAQNGPSDAIYSNSPLKKKKSKKRFIINITVAVLSVVALIVGGICIYADMMLGRIKIVEDTPSASSQPMKVTDQQGNVIQNTGTPVMLNGLFHDDSVLNVLVMGVDDYQENDVGRSDSMMMISLDKRHQKLKVTSFLRDMFVKIPGHDANRINVAYSLGKAPLSVKTIESNFGVDIDNYVTVKYSAFSNIIDRLGGVTITLTKDEAKLVNSYAGEPSSKFVKAGSNRLTGKQARYYSRIRAIGSDFERTHRQRKVFESIVNQFKSSDIGTINGVLYDILPMVTTNMDKNKILEVASNALTYLNYPVSQNRVPADETYEFAKVTIGSVHGNSVIMPDLKKNSQLTAKFIYEDSFQYPHLSENSSSSSISKNQ